jgi:hypothetical protein
MIPGSGYIPGVQDTLAPSDERKYTSRNTPYEQPYGFMIEGEYPHESFGDDFGDDFGSAVVAEVAMEAFTAGAAAAGAIMGGKLWGMPGMVIGAVIGAVAGPTAFSRIHKG